MSEKLSLDNIKPGEKCKIVSITLGSAESQRLLDMGFLRGTELDVIRNAPFADPLEVDIRGAHVSLRHNEAKLLVVERV
ncbi:MAG TPA: ferrous iron transport protein A [Thermotogota bacterium]|nr:ferrous iron transport protein A [Thermotogota bacterium]HPJ88833.1 ferrous iron transport protein A [Thermotogota bacterium]HPR96696.1 ferrous iron transport protein A [Thermotogota bacterium]